MGERAAILRMCMRGLASLRHGGSCGPGESLGQRCELGAGRDEVAGHAGVGRSLCPRPQCPGAEANRVTGLRRLGGKGCRGGSTCSRPILPVLFSKH